MWMKASCLLHDHPTVHTTPLLTTITNEEYTQPVNEMKAVTHMTTGRNGRRQAQQR
jgi:hypothetical protein